LVPLILLDAAGASPSPYWFATRGLGTVTLIILTASVVLGIGTAGRWREEETPGFVLANLHRNLSLLAVLTLLAHIATTVLDPFAGITVRDALVPVGAHYRPVWLGLGVAGFEVLVVVAATSLLRKQVGPRAWRLIHWTAYASWPLAVVHGLGTGSDAQAPWLIGLVAACVVAVVLVVARRLLTGRSALTLRTGAAVVAAELLYFGTVWALQGPLQPGWAARSGTPVAAVSPGPVHPGPDGFSDPLAGAMVRDAAGNTQISFRDTIDTELTITIRSPNGATESLPVVTIARGTRELCAVPASVGATLYAVCGGTRLTITLYENGTASAARTLPAVGTADITGELATSGPLS
jgi:methionine sulfoxide reductase heme-binding subunit